MSAVLAERNERKNIMTIITSVPIIIAILTALEFIYIFILETIKTDSEKTAKTFGMEQSILKQENMNVSMKNQGVYNLGIAALLIASIFISKAMLASIFAYIVLVAAYGAATVDKKIILKQGGLAMIGLILLAVIKLCA